MRHGPVAFPKSDEPHEAPVGVPEEAGAGTIGTRDRKTQLSHSTDPGRGARRNGLVQKEFERRFGGDAFGIQVSQNSPARPRVSNGSELCAVALVPEGGVPLPPRTRLTAGAPQGWGERAPALRPGSSSGPARPRGFRTSDASGRASAHGGRPRTTPRPSRRRRRSLGSWNQRRDAEGKTDRSAWQLGVSSGSGVTVGHVGVRRSPRTQRTVDRGVRRRGRRTTPHGVARPPSWEG